MSFGRRLVGGDADGQLLPTFTIFPYTYII